MTTDRQPIPVLTSLRGVAALCIVFAHGTHEILVQLGGPVLFPLGENVAYAGMTLFFVLSGFVLQYNYGHYFDGSIRLPELRRFAVARFARLYPLWIVTLLILAATHDLGFFSPFWPGIVLQHLGLVHSWTWGLNALGHPQMASMYFQSWSISTEVFFYLLFPAACLAVNRLRTLRAVGAAVAGVAGLGLTAMIAISAAGVAIPDAVGVERDHAFNFLGWLIYYSPYLRLLEFVLGCLCARAFLVGRDAIPGGLLLSLGGALLFGAAALLVDFYANGATSQFVHFIRQNFLFTPGVACLLLGLAVSAPALWRGRLIERIGEASYSLYLLHPFVLGIIHRPDPSDAGTAWHTAEVLMRFGFAVVAAILVSFASYRIIEDPSRRSLRRLLMRSAHRQAGDRGGLLSAPAAEHGRSAALDPRHQRGPVVPLQDAKAAGD